MRSLVVVGVLAAFACGVAGCDREPADSTALTAATTAPVTITGLTATLQQWRQDEINGLVSVQTTNRSAATVDLTGLRLRWSGITDEEPFDSPTKLAPGATFDIRVHQGDARCGDPPKTGATSPTDASVAVADASIDGAPPVTVAIPIDDRRAVLPRVFQHSCQDQRGAWAADLHFGDRWTPSTTPAGKPAVLGTIELRRRAAGEALSVTRINGSVLLRIDAAAAAPSDPVAVLEPGNDALSIPIVIEQSGNCAAHALIESKKSFIIPIGFAVGDEEPVVYIIRFDIPTQRLLFQMINESCGLS